MRLSWQHISTQLYAKDNNDRLAYKALSAIALSLNSNQIPITIIFSHLTSASLPGNHSITINKARIPTAALT